jgi:hypothetical protein
MKIDTKSLAIGLLAGASIMFLTGARVMTPAGWVESALNVDRNLDYSIWTDEATNVQYIRCEDGITVRFLADGSLAQSKR